MERCGVVVINQVVLSKVLYTLDSLLLIDFGDSHAHGLRMCFQMLVFGHANNGFPNALDSSFSKVLEGYLTVEAIQVDTIVG